MNEYYFLFVLALIWIIFGTIQDIRKREVSNWLNFSLISFALAYRLFYSYSFNDRSFFVFGVVGFGFFFLLANVFYYSKVFAGGDAKLLMGLGAILPFSSLEEIFFKGLVFVFVLFLIGAFYGMIYSFFIAYKNKKIFIKNFRINMKKYKFFIFVSALSLLSFLLIDDFLISSALFLIILIFPYLYIYLKSVENCMIVLKSPKYLTEGDWLEMDVVVAGKTIRKTVQGLSLQEIEILRKNKKSVWIKEGIPFVPVFLVSFSIMVFFYLFLNLNFENFVAFLF